ncbi:MAG: YggS family pyridoxal phosphate-dependent enzyme [Rhodospirillum sp.]|nr:YggS family pyridoxal phosphate-dependent enzyme [Rhodospirillum sp.]MCF8491621.1 YggS family pyridoxal phosphate-dependent enzyme [Rhodospirillum sp.]MCF8500138.1 YggS family pyridoxal phosphate-dependent enzyme [Rhodospirillum sp.]
MPETKNAIPLDVAENLRDIRARIARACAPVDRPAEEVTLVAVSKTNPADRIRVALRAGQRVFGENRVQEAQGKWPALKQEFSGVELHLIGPLQTNKVKDALILFDVIETVDRPRLARVLAEEMEKMGRSVPVLIQVNTGEEHQKAGILPAEARTFIGECRDALGLDVQGLMCIPPADEEPSPHFALLREIARDAGLPVLSMGMSGDFEKAVPFGATHVRVGTAIFGSRPKPVA